MPVLPHAKKALRRDQRRAQQNLKVRSAAKSAIKKMRQDPTEENLKLAYKKIDKAAKKGVYHANKAARLKSRLAKLLSA